MAASAQWADTLLVLERLFLLKLALWGALSILVGTALLAIIGRRANMAMAVHSLAFTLVAAGVVVLAVAIVARQGADLRDLAGAVALDRGLWLASGVALGWTSAAVVIAACARTRTPRGAKTTGTALALALHGVAIASLALQLAVAVGR